MTFANKTIPGTIAFSCILVPFQKFELTQLKFTALFIFHFNKANTGWIYISNTLSNDKFAHSVVQLYQLEYKFNCFRILPVFWRFSLACENWTSLTTSHGKSFLLLSLCMKFLSVTTQMEARENYFHAVLFWNSFENEISNFPQFWTENSKAKIHSPKIVMSLVRFWRRHYPLVDNSFIPVTSLLDIVLKLKGENSRWSSPLMQLTINCKTEFKQNSYLGLAMAVRRGNPTCTWW